MKKEKRIVACVLGVIAVLMYVATWGKEDMVPVMSMDETVLLNIVLQDDQHQLIPLSVPVECSSEFACLNHAMQMMSHSYGDLHAVLPQHVQLLSLECTDRCLVNCSKEILEFAPSKRVQIEQALSAVLSKYDAVDLVVENEPTEALKLHDDYLNPVHFVQQDYTKGSFYQMYQTKQINDVELLVPVLIFAKSCDAISVIENYYSMIVSVQFDNVSFQSVQIEEGNPYRLIVSSECIENQGLKMNLILPILHSLKAHTDAQVVDVVVSDVLVEQINLNELILNEIHLCD